MEAAGDSDQRRRPVPAVIAVVLRGEQVLLVRRANPPDAGRWGFPGGKIEWGETVEAAAERELEEETGIVGTAEGVLTALDAFDRSPSGDLRHHYVLVAVQCRWIAGEPTAADDALDARWFALDTLDAGDAAFSHDVVSVACRAAAKASGVPRP